MRNLFGSGKPDHPLADAKEARRILDGMPADDPLRAIEELGHMFESVLSVEGFKPEYRVQLVQMIDEAAQGHLRKLQREYLSTPRLTKFQENRMWTVIHDFHRQSGMAFSACVDLQFAAQKGADVLKSGMPSLSVRALRALAAQMKWKYVRYGPFDRTIWGMIARNYAFAEARGYARAKVIVYPGVPGESSPEQEFLRAVMLATSSPDSLLPVEIEIAERLIAHFSGSFTFAENRRPDVTYWMDLATGQPPLRLARPPQYSPTLRFVGAGKAAQELGNLIRIVKSTNAVPSNVGLGDNCEPGVALDVLDHLALYWSPRPPERKALRHRFKSRLSVTRGFDGVLTVLDPSGSAHAAGGDIESWVVENVSTGGFGASIPQIRGEWLGIGCLLGLQPEGGDNWIVGLIRRFNRESSQQGTVGIQTLSTTALRVKLKLRSSQAGTRRDADTGILLNPSDDAAEALILLRPGVLVAGQNLEFERDGKRFLLMSAEFMERGDDYELMRFRQMKWEPGG
jgi:hypothetical protein